jgi:hypothetical protein
MIAAVYARKSQDQNLPDVEKSVTLQIERAVAFAGRMGWTVDPEQIYVCRATAASRCPEGAPPMTRKKNPHAVALGRLGGQTVTRKKLAHLARIRAARRLSPPAPDGQPP